MEGAVVTGEGSVVMAALAAAEEIEEAAAAAEVATSEAEDAATAAGAAAWGQIWAVTARASVAGTHQYCPVHGSVRWKPEGKLTG
jgi:hypothetical protein